MNAGFCESYVYWKVVTKPYLAFDNMQNEIANTESKSHEGGKFRNLN